MSWGIWITGIPGSGKSVLAHAAGVELRARGYPVRILELDQIRKTLTPEPRYTDTERDVVYRALGWMARLLTEAGVPVIVDATAHRRVWRDLARAAIPRFAEVQIVCPLEVARERERSRSGGNAPRGIYGRAGRPGATVPGLDVPYEPALAPELVIDSSRESVAEAAHRIADLAVRLTAGTEGPALGTAGWAIWITGRPGTGKTTVTSRVVEALATRAGPVRALDLALFAISVHRFARLGPLMSRARLVSAIAPLPHASPTPAQIGEPRRPGRSAAILRSRASARCGSGTSLTRDRRFPGRTRCDDRRRCRPRDGGCGIRAIRPGSPQGRAIRISP